LPAVIFIDEVRSLPPPACTIMLLAGRFYVVVTLRRRA
jgi:hypothetical protein